jgi:hypothetical protein
MPGMEPTGDGGVSLQKEPKAILHPASYRDIETKNYGGPGKGPPSYGEEECYNVVMMR